MLACILFISVVIIVLYLIYDRVNKKYEYFKIRNIPFKKPTFLLGNSFPVFFKRVTLQEYSRKLYSEFPNVKIIGFYQFIKPLYFIRDPELLRQIAIKDFDHFQDHQPLTAEASDDLFLNSLIFLTGPKWRDMRATLSPAFTGSKMRSMFKLVTNCADNMAKHFVKQSEAAERINWDMKELFSRCSNDVIASCAFGVEINSFENKNNEFFLTGQKVVKFNSVKFISILLLPKLMHWLNINFIATDVANYFRSLMLDTMDMREKNNIVRPDMINTMMQVRKGNSLQPSSASEKEPTESEGFATVEESQIGKTVVKRDWSDNELLAQCFIFFLAGFDSSSTIMAALTHEVAVNAEIQDKLYQEIVEINKKMNGAQVDYDTLQKMKYMDQVVSETLRKWPPAPISDRVCVKNYTFDDGNLKLSIEKGISVSMPIYAFHHDPKYFPEPEKFDPERFSNENKGNIVPGTYIPFGIGPRNCIGSRFALMQVKAVIYSLVLRFKLTPNEKSRIPLELKKGPFTTAFEGGVHLDLNLRQNSISK